jgi:hypothetical protein
MPADRASAPLPSPSILPGCGGGRGRRSKLPAKLVPSVEEFQERLEKLNADQGGRLTVEKGDDPKDLRKALEAAAGSLNRRIRFPFRGEEGSLSFYLEGKQGHRKESQRGGSRLEGWAGGRGGDLGKRSRDRMAGVGAVDMALTPEILSSVTRTL